MQASLPMRPSTSLYSFVDLLSLSLLLQLCFQPLVESIPVVAAGNNGWIAGPCQCWLFAQSKGLFERRKFHGWRQLPGRCNTGKAACPRLKEHEPATSKPKVSCAIFTIHSDSLAGLPLHR